MSENTIERWQWVKGDDAGTVEEVKQTTPEFKVFASGRKCANALLNEFMIPLDQNNSGYEFGNFNGQEVNLNTPLSNSGNPIASQQLQQMQSAQIQIPKQEESPIKKLINKNKNKNAIDLETRVIVEVPTIETFGILLSSFGEEVFEEILNDAISQMDINSISQQLKTAMKEKLMQVYNLKND